MRELWRSRILSRGPGHSFPSRLTNVNGTLFFAAQESTNGRELWKSDGTTTVIVKGIRFGPEGSSIRNLTDVAGGTVFFQADDGTNGSELWKTDGTGAGTVPGQRHLARINRGKS